MFITTWYKAGEFIIVKNHTPIGFGAPGKKRSKRKRETPKAMSKYNNTKRAEKLQMLILVNFDKGFHVTLDYPVGSRPETYKEAEDNLRKCLNKVSRRLKKKDKQFKYIAITERGKKAAALHHHVIIEGDSQILDELIAVWGNHIKISQMYPEGAYKDLADYFCKVETKEEQTKGKSKYHRSRNLKEPLKRVAFAQGSIKDDPVVPDGYQIMPETLVNGFNELVGVRYQHFMAKKTTPEPKSEPKRDKKCTKRESIWESIKKIFKKRRQ